MADPLQSERLAVLAAPQALVGDQRAAGVGGRELTHRLVLLLVGGDERVPDRHARGVGHEDEAQPHTYWLLAAQ